MRAQRLLQLERHAGVLLRRAGWILRETALVAGFLALIEMTGKHAVHDGADLMALGGASILLALLAKGGRVGWLPLTGAFMEQMSQGLRAGIRRLMPGHAIAFRRNPDVPAKPDTVLLWPLALVGTLALVVLAAGPWLLPAALHLKSHVSYALYLSVMALVWTLQAGTVFLGLIVASSWLRRRARGGAAPSLVLLLGWMVGSLLLARAPGIVPVLLLGVIAGWRWASRAHPLTGRYQFCRRGEDGTAYVLPVQTLLLRVHTLAMALLALAVALAAAPRLWAVSEPAAPFAFTGWLGLSTSVAALILAQQAGVHLRRIAGSPHRSPELPLTPTLWMRTPLAAGTATPAWMRAARAAGWWISQGPRPPGDRVRSRARGAGSCAPLRAAGHSRRGGGALPVGATVPRGHTPPVSLTIPAPRQAATRTTQRARLGLSLLSARMARSWCRARRGAAAYGPQPLRDAGLVWPALRAVV